MTDESQAARDDGSIPMESLYLGDAGVIHGRASTLEYVKALLERVEKLEEESAALTKALTGLTCNGSEFFIRKGDRFTADIDACVAYVRRAREDAHRRTVEAIRRAQKAEAALTASQPQGGDNG